MTERMLDQEERARLRRLCEEATPGPWSARWDGRAGRNVLMAEGVIHRFVARMGMDDGVSGHDGDFIAAARSALPRLLDALEAVERERDRARREYGEALREALGYYTALRAVEHGPMFRAAYCLRHFGVVEEDDAAQIVRHALAARAPEGGTDGE